MANTNKTHNAHDRPTIERGEQVSAGRYECASCGHIINHDAEGELPTCPEDDGHHSIEAWYPLDEQE